MKDNTVPEISWYWRRWYTYVSKILYMAPIFIVIFMGITDPVKWVALALVGAAVILDTLYIAGASVIDWAQVAAGWKGKQPNEQV